MAEKKRRFLEIRHIETEKVETRIEVTGKTDRLIEKLENGMSINLNHAEYYVHDTINDDPETVSP